MAEHRKAAMTRKHKKLLALCTREIFWSDGADHPWRGNALTSPWFIGQLCDLAASAPEAEIDKLIELCD